MKRILIHLFSLFIFTSFAQTEIWGVKEMAGKADGGILFKVDSASNQIEIKHRFTDYSQEYYGQALVQLANPKEYIGIIGNELVKINVESGDIDQQFIFPNYTKNLVYAADDFVYYVSGDSIVKINPTDLSISKQNGQFYNDPISVHPQDENKLIVWSHQFYSNKFLSYYDLLTKEIERIYDVPNYDICGPASFIQDKMFFLGSGKTNDKMTMIIFSYDMVANTYTEEYSFVNDSLDYHWGINWLSGLVSDNDHQLYGVGIVVPGSEKYHMFSFDVQTSELNVLAEIPAEIGGSSVGYLSIDGDHIYGNTSAGAAQGKGSVFSFNRSNNQFELLHTYDSVNYIETNGNLMLNSDGHLIGITPYFNDRIERKVFELNPIDLSFEEAFNITFETDPSEGYFPGDFVRANNGCIYGVTFRSYLGEETNDNIGDVFYKYNIETEEYQKLFLLKDAFVNESSNVQLFNSSNDYLFGFVYGYDKSSYCKAFDFNVETNEIETIYDEKLRVKDWIQENEQSFIGLGYANAAIYRLNKNSQELDIVYEHHRGVLLNPVLDQNGDLIANLKTNYNDSDSDSLFIVKYDFSEESFQVLGEMNQFIDEDVNSGDPDVRKLRFKFVYNSFDGEKLIGDFWQYESYGWTTTYHRLISLDLNDFEIQEFDAEGTEYNRSQYSFANDYSKSGSVYALNSFDSYHNSNWDCGYLRQIDPPFDALHVLDKVEMETTWYEYDDGDEPVKFNSLKMFKVADISGVFGLEESVLNIFVTNGILNIQSQEEIQKAQVYIFDMSGRKVGEFTAHNFTQTSRQLKLSSGSYIVRISSDEYFESHKISIQ